MLGELSATDSFFLQSNIPPHGFTIIYLSVYQLKDIRNISSLHPSVRMNLTEVGDCWPAASGVSGKPLLQSGLGL